jgi:hypothetical protein
LRGRATLVPVPVAESLLEHEPEHQHPFMIVEVSDSHDDRWRPTVGAADVRANIAAHHAANLRFPVPR